MVKFRETLPENGNNSAYVHWRKDRLNTQTRTNKLGLRFSANGCGNKKVVIAVVLVQLGLRWQLNVVGHNEVRQHNAPRDAVMAGAACPRLVALALNEGDQAESRNVRSYHHERPAVAFFHSL